MAGERKETAVRRRKPPNTHIIVPPSIILSRPKIERDLHLISDLILIQLGDLVISEGGKADLSRETTILVLQDEILLHPSAPGALAALLGLFTGNPTLQF